MNSHTFLSVKHVRDSCHLAPASSVLLFPVLVQVDEKLGPNQFPCSFLRNPINNCTKQLPFRAAFLTPRPTPSSRGVIRSSFKSWVRATHGPSVRGNEMKINLFPSNYNFFLFFRRRCYFWFLGCFATAGWLLRKLGSSWRSNFYSPGNWTCQAFSSTIVNVQWISRHSPPLGYSLPE